MEEISKSYWFLVLTLISELILGLQLLIKPEGITDIQFILFGIIFLSMGVNTFLKTLLKFVNNKIKQHGRK